MADREKYATFLLGGIYFGLPAVRVQEVLECLEIVPVPLAPPALPGIINLRGQILTVLDLRKRLQLPPLESAQQEDARMVVVRAKEGLITFLIDRVGEILDVDSASFEPPAETLKASLLEVTTHVCKLQNRLLMVLDTEKIVQLPDVSASAFELEARQKLEKAPAS